MNEKNVSYCIEPCFQGKKEHCIKCRDTKMYCVVSTDKTVNFSPYKGERHLLSHKKTKNRKK
jgi:hypothetical protein